MNDLEKNGTSSTLHIQAMSHHQDPYSQPPKPAIANPSILGLFSFGATALVSGLYTVGARGVAKPDLIIGMAIFSGGLGQFTAGLWDYVRGDVFGANAFAVYGTFWMSYAVILLPGSGVAEAFKANPVMYANGVGIYLSVWFLVTALFWIATLRKCIAFVVTFGFLAMTFMVLAAADFTRNPDVARAGGVIGIFTSFMAFYIGLSELLAAEDRPVFTLPLGML